VKRFAFEPRRTFSPMARAARRRATSRGLRSEGPVTLLATIAVLLASATSGLANPDGGHVVAGEADIVQRASTTNIDQRTPTAIIDWRSFSIAPHETVNFNQPTAWSATLNRVIGNERSVIAGALNANGKVFIVNSAGVLFTKDAQVDVGGLVASTLDISNRSFSAGKMVFSGNSSASVINRGNISARPGGHVALLGADVANEGAITATLGSVTLAAGKSVTLNYGGDALLDVTVSKGALDALVQNKGVIKADGGRVVMTARAADAVLSAQVNNTGVIQAQTMSGLMGGASRAGSVRLAAVGGKVHVGGKIDASAPRSGRGGAIVTRGARVTIAEDAVATTKAASGAHGDWTIASLGFVIGENGNVRGAKLGTLLGSSNIAIRSVGEGRRGDIDVEENVTWSADTRLTLDATRNIDMSADIAATGASAGLAMNFGEDYVFGSSAGSISLTGSRASLAINGQSYTIIHTLDELAAISRDPDAIAYDFYALGRDIDASGVSFEGPVIHALEGTLAGLGHKIENLTIIDAEGVNADAMIGVAGASAAIRDIRLVDARVFAGDYLARAEQGTAAALVNDNSGLIANAHVEGGLIAGVGNVGGLVATNNGVIVNSSSDIEVNGRSAIGGLVGVNGLFGSIIGSSASGPIFAGAPLIFNADMTISLDDSLYIGGLVGLNGGLVTQSHADAAITTLNSSNVGGLVGDNVNIGFGLPGGDISDSYATGWINATWSSRLTLGDTAIGGLVGQNDGGTISDTLSKLDISLTNQAALYTPSVGDGGFFVPMTGIGGLVGVNKTNFDEMGGVIQRSRSDTNIYNDGWVDAVGGLVGNAYGGSITDSFAAGMVTSGVYVYPDGAAGLIGNVFNSDLVSLSGNGWDINGTGQTAGVGFGGGGMPGVIGVGDPSLPPPFGFPAPANPAASVSGQTRLAVAQLGATIGTQNTRLDAATPSSERLATAGAAAIAARSDASFEERTKVTEPPPPRAAPARPVQHASLGSAPRTIAAPSEDAESQHRAARRSSPRPAAKKRQDSSFGASIRSIEIDGKRFDLQEAPAGAAKPRR
jgi:filamentous hemagglutinin family protein